MVRIAPLACATLLAPALALGAPGGALAASGSGGTAAFAPVETAPSSTQSPEATGAVLAGAPVATRFKVAPRRVVSGEQALKFHVRVVGTSRHVRAWAELVRRGKARERVRAHLGRIATGTGIVELWKRPLREPLRPGRYDVELHVVDPRGRVLARGASTAGAAVLRVKRPPPPPEPAPSPTPAPSPAPPPAPGGSSPGSVATLPGVFPVAGAHTYGGPDARFGVGRPGHIHEGQDVPAAEGTPVVAPRAGTIEYVAYQASGAGYYVVMQDASVDRAYVFMHLEKGSTAVAVGDRVAPGDPIGRVGATGDATGPHLHFELWIGGWQPSGGHPVDPLPQLERWDGS